MFALPIALPCDCPVAATRRAYLSRSQHKVDIRQDVVDPVRVVLNAARMHDHSGFRAAIESRGLYDLLCGHACNL